MPPHQREPRRALAQGQETIGLHVQPTRTAMLDAWRKSSAFGSDFEIAGKVGMDWTHLLRLRGVMTEDEQHLREVIGKLFALLTAMFEDGADLAVRGQNPAATDRMTLASGILDLGQEITAIAEAIVLTSDASEN